MGRGPRRTTREEWARAAQTAWRRLKDDKMDRWPLWAEMTPMLRLCRDDAMRAIGLDPEHDETPTNNGKYNAAMTQALRAAKLEDVPRTERQACIEAYPYLPDIAAYRDELRTSSNEQDRRKYINQQMPQAVWREYRKANGLDGDREKPEPKFLDMKVREMLALPDARITRELALNVGDERTYALATGLLHRLTVPMRAVLEGDLVEINEQRKANERQFEIIQGLHQEKENLRAEIAALKAAKE